jgi:hypothetical protein
LPSPWFSFSFFFFFNSSPYQLLKLIALPAWKLRTFPKRFDLLVVLGLAVAQGLPWMWPTDDDGDDDDENNSSSSGDGDDGSGGSKSGENGGGSGGSSLSMLKVQILLRALVLLRVMTVARGTRDIFETVFRIRHVRNT